MNAYLDKSQTDQSCDNSSKATSKQFPSSNRSVNICTDSGLNSIKGWAAVSTGYTVITIKLCFSHHLILNSINSHYIPLKTSGDFRLCFGENSEEMLDSFDTTVVFCECDSNELFDSKCSLFV